MIYLCISVILGFTIQLFYVYMKRAFLQKNVSAEIGMSKIRSYPTETKSQKSIIVIDQYKNKKYAEMVDVLGPPIDKTGYKIKNAPTKSWNYGELFSKYPKTTENENIQIMEATWDMENYLLLACYHLVDGENRCLVAKKIRKGLKY